MFLVKRCKVFPSINAPHTEASFDPLVTVLPFSLHVLNIETADTEQSTAEE